MAWTSKLPLFACATIIILALFTAYDLNGGSFDFTDRELILVVTDSMDGDVNKYDIDSFPANTLVMVEHLPISEVRFLREGDVISYNDEGIKVQHRIIQANGDSFYVHGDNNHSTEVVLLEDVNGKVVGTNWILGHILALISSNFLAFLVVMFVISASIAVFGVYRKSPREAAE